MEIFLMVGEIFFVNSGNLELKNTPTTRGAPKITNIVLKNLIYINFQRRDKITHQLMFIKNNSQFAPESKIKWG
jgi:hypothetical protein